MPATCSPFTVAAASGDTTRPMNVAQLAPAPTADLRDACHRPAPRVRLLIDPDDSVECVRELCARHDLGRGVVVCHPTPGGGSRAVLAQDVLVSLGKRPGGLAVEGVSRRGWELAGVWLRAERTRHLVVLRAHLLPAARWRDLGDLAASTGVMLWLVCHQVHLDSDRRAVLTELTGTTEMWPLRQRWRAALIALPERVAVTATFPTVSDVDFPVFRANAHRLLDSEGFARFDEVYRATVRTARVEARLWRDARHTLRPGQRPAYERELVAAALQRLTVDAETSDEVFTRLRAAQVGFFVEGVLLGLRFRPGRLGTITTLAPRSAPRLVARVRTLCCPHTAAVLAIAVATGLGPDDLQELHLADLTDLDAPPGGGGETLDLAVQGVRYRLPAPFAAAVRAAVADCDSNTAMLLATRGGRGIGGLLTQAAACAGVALPGPVGHVEVTDLHPPATRL